MKYSKHIPKTDPQLSNTLQILKWKRIKEPQSVAIATFASIPFMLMGAWLVGGLFYFLFPQVKAMLQLTSFSFSISLPQILLFILASFLMLILHEFLHAIWIPDVITSNKTIWGITPFGGFVATTEKITKARFIVISLFPFLTLSILLPIVLYFLNCYHPLLFLLCILNAMGSCVDLLNLALIAFQVPNKASIINNGFETFYK